ncbi:MAG TPA: hypothetical protein VLI90_18690, partial [Tepidisphaeraceae bacterium]|nr:hypothetical protein [Tepidisphaeraceae bacterium]
MRWIAIIQAVYFAVTGVWPIVHIKSFIAVTGPKTDIWLVRTVGLLITVVGVVIGVAGWRGEINLPIVLLATGSAAALAGV